MAIDSTAHQYVQFSSLQALCEVGDLYCDLPQADSFQNDEASELQNATLPLQLPIYHNSFCQMVMEQQRAFWGFGKLEAEGERC